MRNGLAMLLCDEGANQHCQPVGLAKFTVGRFGRVRFGEG